MCLTRSLKVHWWSWKTVMKLYYTKGYDSIMLALLRLREPAMVTLTTAFWCWTQGVTDSVPGYGGCIHMGAECKNAYALCLRCRLRNPASQNLNWSSQLQLPWAIQPHLLNLNGTELSSLGRYRNFLEVWKAMPMLLLVQPWQEHIVQIIWVLKQRARLLCSRCHNTKYFDVWQLPWYNNCLQ